MKKSALLLVVMLVVTMCFCLASCDKDDVLVQHVCSFGEWTVTEPTCEADGARTRKCERCGAEETVVLQKSGHTEVIDAAKTATCTETGLTEGKHCSVCNKVLVAQKEIAKLGHSYGEWIIVSELTCTTDGEKKRVCQTCGYEDKQIEKAVGHKISEEWTIDKEATPDSDGQKSRHCKNCDYITDIIVIRMHTHSFADDFTCHDRECTVENCGYIEPATTDHTYGSWIEEPAATCIDKGTKKRSCENCGFIEEEDINALGHDFSEEWTIDVAATCEHVGSKSHHCSRCSEKSDVTEIEKADHAYGEWTVKTAATCTTDRVESRTCSVCGKEETNIIENTALGHDKVTHEAKAATCTENGWEEYETCTRCDYTTYTVIPATGHDYNADGVCNKCGKAKPTETDASHFTFEYDSELDGYVIKKYNGSDTAIVIPSAYDDGTHGRKAVTSIGSSAFYGCGGLTSITIPDSVTSIGFFAFHGCSGLTSIYYTGDIASWCGISGLNYIVSSSRTLYIGGNKIEGDLVIPDGVTSIGSSAFQGCSGLTSITIPDSVTSIGDDAFLVCSGLTNIYYTGDIAGWCGISGLDEIMSNSPTLYIGGNKVEGELVIPDSVTSIGSSAFSDCSGLTSITIPDSVTSIGSYAFYNCSGLTSITIPDSVTSIGNGAFKGCSGLTSMTIGSGVTSIGFFAFYGCSGLTSIYYTGDIAGWCGISGRGLDEIMSSSRTLYIGGNKVEGELVIPDSVTSIGSSAFQGCSGLTSITIPDSVTSIGKYAFYGCSGLTSIYYTGDIAGWCGISGLDEIMSNSRTLYIGGNKVEGDLVIPDGVTSIGDGAFRGCSGLTSITIPDSVTSIGFVAFNDCSGLTSIYYTGDIAGWCGMSGLNNIMSNSPTLYIGGNKIEGDLVIPDGVTSIGSYAFEGCSGLTSVTIGSGVTSIGNGAFSGCSGLTEIEVSESNTVYSSKDGILYNKSQTEFICIPKNIQGSIAIPDGVTSIGGGAFYECNGLTSITIPESVMNIEVGVFFNCSGLTTVNWNATACMSNGETGKSPIFENCAKLVVFCIGDNVTTLPSFGLLPNITVVYYKGTPSQWNDLRNSNLLEKKVYFYSETQVYVADKYWHYVDGEIVIWEKVEHIEHEFTEWTEKTGATCTTDKVEYRVCPICEIEETRTIENTALGHIRGDFLYSIKPSCSEDGYEYYRCERCSAEITVIIPKTGHDLVHYEAQTPTCTMQGWDEYDVCSRCGYTTQSYIPALGHDFGEDNVCSICGINKDDACSVGLRFTYITDSDSYATEYYSGSDRVVYVPSYYDDGSHGKKPVSVISSSTFSFNSAITRVYLTSSIKKIEDVAFVSTFINEITIPSSVEKIGEGAFGACRALTQIIVEDSEYYYVKNNCLIEKATKTIIAACKGCSIPVDGSVTRIGASAFEGISYNEIFIPASIEEIGDGAFSIYYDRNEPRPAYPTITVDENNGRYYVNENCLIDRHNKILVAGNSDGMIPDDGSVTIIGGGAFFYNTATSIVIPDGVTEIRYSAFSASTQLQYIVLPKELISIGWNAINTNLARPVEKVYYKGSQEEWNGININNVVNIFSSSTIYYYSETKPITGNYWHYVDGNIVVWPKIYSDVIIDEVKYSYYPAYDGYIVTGVTNSWSGSQTFGTGVLSIPLKISDGTNAAKSVVAIAEGAFKNNNKISIVAIPACVREIGKRAFYNCQNLMAVYFADDSELTVMEEGVFKDCINLIAIFIGKGSKVERIKADAFANCSILGLELGVFMPKNLKSIEDGAFDGCEKAWCVFYGGTQEAWQSIEMNETYRQKFAKAYIVYYSETEPTEQGLYWRFDENKHTLYDGFDFTPPITWDDYVPGFIMYAPNNDNTYQAQVSSNFVGECIIPEKYDGYNGELTVTSISIHSCSGITALTIPACVNNLSGNFSTSTQLTSITYLGTIEEWKAMEKSENIFKDSSVSVIHCSDGDIEI